MRLIAASLTALALATTASLGAADGLELSFQNGRVTLIATDVAVTMILEEWGYPSFKPGLGFKRTCRLHSPEASQPRVECDSLQERHATGIWHDPRSVRD